MFAGLALLLALFGSGCTHLSVDEEVRSEPYACVSSSGPIAIDGRIDEDAWQNAAPITVFNVFGPEGAENLSPTEARILWDNKTLYVAVSCMDADIRSFSDEPDAELWNGDAVEFFIRLDRDTPVHYEFVAAPNGTLFDARHPDREPGGFRHYKVWSSGARVAAVVDGTDSDPSDTDNGYTVEMAIPLNVFQDSVPPADGVAWTFAVCRYDFSKLYEKPLLLMTMHEAPHDGFHYYEGYADLVFKRGKGCR